MAPDVQGDWTHRRAAETDAGLRTALFDATEELAEIGSWEWLFATSELLWSDNLYRIYGLSPGEIEPTPEFVIAETHPDDRERVARQVYETIESGEIRTLEYRWVRQDGQVRHLRSTVAVAKKRAGRPYRTVGCVQDLTERRRAEQELAAHFAVAQALTEWGSLESGAERLLAKLGHAIDAVAGALWVPHDDVLMARILWHQARVKLPEFESITRQTRFPPGVGLPGRAWQQRKPVWTASLAAATSGPRDQAAVREGVSGAVAIPAIAGEEVLAVVELASRDPVEQTQRLTQSLTGIGYALGQFLAQRRGQLAAPVLTGRQLEVLTLAAQGLSAHAIADRLSVSPATVRTHFQNIYPKLGVPDKASAVARALRLGLIE
jgi:PAS domain S-box-containing protein